MKLMFIGADHEVTGSCHYIEYGNKKLLVDYGMEQGVNVFENVSLPCSPAEIDYIFITHAHIDHTGMLPLLYVQGFRGRIFATTATCELCEIMLLDTAHIQESEAEWRNRKAERAGKALVEPLFTVADAKATLDLFVNVDYKEKLDIDDNLTVRFTDAGHLLGSASIEMWISENDNQRKIVFSGDIGNKNRPLIKDPQYITDADYILTESTYGDRLHAPAVDHVEELRIITQETLDRGGNVIIPAFAVGRTQELLYYYRKLKEEGLIKGHDNFKVYVDSPLAVEATQVFRDNLLDCLDDETRRLVNSGINPIGFRGLKTAVSAEESKQINFNTEPKVIISAAGMCDAGRIRHHLKHNLWRPESTIVFAGYQSEGTLGRSLQDGVDKVRLFGEDIEVRAHIATLQGISGHADQKGLLEWISAFTTRPKKVFVVHGEDSTCDSYARLVHEKTGYDAQAPWSGSVFDLIEDKWIKETTCVPILKDKLEKKKETGVYLRLVSAGERLLAVIKENKNGANKDLAKFADQINSLCDKWQL